MLAYFSASSVMGVKPHAQHWILESMAVELACADGCECALETAEIAYRSFLKPVGLRTAIAELTALSYSVGMILYKSYDTCLTSAVGNAAIFTDSMGKKKF